MGEHKAEVFEIKELVKHPNADNLSIVKFYNYECIVRTADFKLGDLAVYIAPDSLVPLEREEFAFLAKKGPRIRSQKLRGIQSTGLVIKAPPGAKLADDLADYYGITHYNPPEATIQNVVGAKQRRWFAKWSYRFLGDKVKLPKYQGPYYDIENWQRYSHIFKEGEYVEVTEKIHGMNVRYTYQNGKYHACSRKFWRKETKNCPYWQILNKPENKWLKRLCKLNPNLIIYGEIYGEGIQKEINYFTKPEFRVFDIYDPINDYWFTYEKINNLVLYAIENKFWWEKIKDWLFGSKEGWRYFIPIVPLLFSGKYNDDVVKLLIGGKSIVSKTHKGKVEPDIREGIVIKALPNRNQEHFGRAILKAVNPEYLER